MELVPVPTVLRVKIPRLDPVRKPGSRNYSNLYWAPAPRWRTSNPEELESALRQGWALEGWQFVLGRKIEHDGSRVPTVHEIRPRVLERDATRRILPYKELILVSPEMLPYALRRVLDLHLGGLPDV